SKSPIFGPAFAELAWPQEQLAGIARDSLLCAHNIPTMTIFLENMCVPLSRRARSVFGYRQTWKTVRPALLAWYVRRQTGRYHWREVADLLGEDSHEKTRKA